MHDLPRLVLRVVRYRCRGRWPLWLAVLPFAVIASAAVAARDVLPERIEVGNFSIGRGELPPGWRPFEFKGVRRRTEYGLVRDSEGWVVRAVSEASASGLIYPLEVDLREYPILRWRWKVENVIEKGDVTKRRGDDYPARIYVAFQYDPAKLSIAQRLLHQTARVLYGDIPGQVLNYIWGNREPRNKVFANPSPFTDFSRLLVCRSRADPLGTWFEEERNLYSDYQLAFGAEPPLLIGIGIMTDTDNTGDSATAYYGDITLLREPSKPPSD